MDPRRSSSHVVEPGAQRVQILDQENLRAQWPFERPWFP
jgi:hypothetical protein